MSYQHILTEVKDSVGILTLNRPDALNALCGDLLTELADAVATYEADDDVRVMVITGSEKAFAAGADITEMSSKGFMDFYKENFMVTSTERIAECRKPIIAAVSGYALGGGCELAMLCDFIIASDTAQFGQPEITIGTIPGIGGSQRLTRAIGKAKAMEMILTGRMMDAQEAERTGLVARIVPTNQLMEETLKTAHKIASMSVPITMMAKEVVNAAYETTLAEGVRFERRMFHASFSSEDQKEGMAAFVEKRKANFKDK